jgi:hypothetical protein
MKRLTFAVVLLAATGIGCLAYADVLDLLQASALTACAAVTRAREAAPIPARSDADRPAPAGWAALRLLADVDISF